MSGSSTGEQECRAKHTVQNNALNSFSAFSLALCFSAGAASMVCASSTFQPAALGPAPLAGKWENGEASSNPALKHGANENSAHCL